MTVRLTKRRLRAIDAAVTAMASGMDQQGDWPDDVTREDFEAALRWIDEQLAKRKKPSA